MRTAELPNDRPPAARTRSSGRGRIIAGLVALSLVMVGAGVGIGALIWSSRSNKATVASTPAPASNAAPSTRGSWASRDIHFRSAGRVDITRMWDAFNNCAEGDGTQHKDMAVAAGASVSLGFTTVSSGSCYFESSRMHWKIARLDDGGKPTGDTSEVSLNQKIFTYYNKCEDSTGAMQCEQFRSPDVTISF